MAFALDAVADAEVEASLFAFAGDRVPKLFELEEGAPRIDSVPA